MLIHIKLMFGGLFEVHITVDPENNYMKLLEFRNKYAQQKGMKLVYAISTVCNNQYMISYFTNKKKEKDVIDKALQFKKEMQDMGINVLRVKVEGYHCKGIPQNINEYVVVKNYINNTYPNSKSPYFEFHVKMSNADKFSFQDIESKLAVYNGEVAMSVNLCSSSRKPLITIRKYDMGKDEAMEQKNLILDNLKQLGFKFEDQLQEEFSVYDDFSSVDNGWLISK